MRCVHERALARPGKAERRAARWLLPAWLALLLPSCGGSSPASSSAAATPPPIQGQYLLSVRPGALCSDIPVALLEVEVEASVQAGHIEIGGENASGSFQPTTDAGSGLAGRLEVYASDVALPPGSSDTARGDFYVFAQASGGLTQTAGRAEVRDGQLTGSVTLYRTLDGVTRTDRCSVPGHSFSLVGR